MSGFRQYFPNLEDQTQVYLDSAATSQRLDESLLAMQTYYQKNNANVHRGQYDSAQRATESYENARQDIASFLGAKSSDNIVFTSGATEAINLVASGLPRSILKGNTILICGSEHHANLLPWQILAQQQQMHIKVLRLDEHGAFNQDYLEAALDAINNDIAIVAFAHVSNVLGNIYPIKEICHKAYACQAISVIDGTQATAHLKVDVEALQCDFYAISGHKMYAGTGIGALYLRTEYLSKLQPLKWGGEMITSVSWHDYHLQSGPLKFEAGTPNIAGAIGMAAAANFISRHLSEIHAHETQLYRYLVKQLSQYVDAKKIKVYGNTKDSISLVSISLSNIHHNDAASYLASRHIAVRAGHHCAMPLMQDLGIEGSLRVSIACYTTLEDIDAFIKALDTLFNEEIAHDIRDEEYHQQSEAEIEIQLKNTSDWNSKHRLLLLFSKKLAILELSNRTSCNLVNGCEAQVWIDKANPPMLHGFSDSKVVRGIMAVLLDKQSRLGDKEVQSYDFAGYLHDLGLSSYFSKGRRDGVMQMIKRIQALRGI